MAFKIVATAPYKNWSIILEAFKTSWKSPITKPKIVLKRALNPKGAALIKSSKKPDTNPVDSANNAPLFNETNIVIINKKSGTAGKKVKFETTAVSNNKKQNIAKIVVKKDFTILTPVHSLYQQS